ncbi:MAG TPA: helix-turn-helix domain-containing protein [Candidatus Dormibacteraeota bacterium]|nr:helix-turn-helix domain-containing protein [Candidatus Dormibacteraeota bacterium]
MTVGGQLAAKRGERGLSIEQVAASTRIRAENLRALEADDHQHFAAPVYVRGYIRTYATFLDLDPEELIAQLPDDVRAPDLAIKVMERQRRRGAAITTPMVAAAGLVLLGGGFAGYAWRQISVDQHALVAATSPSPQAGAPATPSASPAVQARPIVVGVRVTDSVWINVMVDGNPQYGDSGRTLPAGSVVYFTGVDVKITSGKASATFITIDGHDVGAMGIGVATREFSSQTSP